MRNVLIKEIMITKVVTAHINDSLTSVEEKFRKHKIRHIPVVDSDNKLLGIVSERGLLRCDVTRKTEDGYTFDKEQMDQLILKYVMTPDPFSLSPDDNVMALVDVMARDKYGCIPIVGQGNVLKGIVTQIDILRLLSKMLHAQFS